MVDDPREFGAVAAANSLSDVYAMGGRPLMALNLCGFPEDEVPAAVIGEIFAGAAEKCAEADVAVAGGHTVRDVEIKFGLSVTGVVHPDRILRNTGARPGDLLLLTKPLGTGALAAAHKKGELPPGSAGYAALVATMTALNRCGELLAGLGARAATDITGFGLTGHACEMGRGSDALLEIEIDALPLLPDALALCAAGFTCGGTRANLGYTRKLVVYPESADDGLRGLLNDPQTSGGLLIAAPPDRAAAIAAAALDAGAPCAPVIGRVADRVAGGPCLRFV